MDNHRIQPQPGPQQKRFAIAQAHIHLINGRIHQLPQVFVQCPPTVPAKGMQTQFGCQNIVRASRKNATFTLTRNHKEITVNVEIAEDRSPSPDRLVL